VSPTKLTLVTEGLEPRTPASVTLLSQHIGVEFAENLHCECPGHDGAETEEKHAVPCYGYYNKHDQTITLDADLKFERLRETFLHENLHAMLAIAQLDSIMPEGMDEHVVTVLAPILLSWMRDNPAALTFVLTRHEG